MFSSLHRDRDIHDIDVWKQQFYEYYVDEPITRRWKLMTYVPQTVCKIYFTSDYHEIGLNYKSNLSSLVISNKLIGGY